MAQGTLAEDRAPAARMTTNLSYFLPIADFQRSRKMMPVAVEEPSKEVLKSIGSLGTEGMCLDMDMSTSDGRHNVGASHNEHRLFDPTIPT